jgi:hypothetical protein
MSAYRNMPITVTAAEPTGRCWVIHPFLVVPSRGGDHTVCRWCGYVGGELRQPRCFGHRFLWLFAWQCPRVPHHHVLCRSCARDWLEATCDEAPPKTK